MIKLISYSNEIGIYENRYHAGKVLANFLTKYKENAVIYCIPNGGVPVAEELSEALHIPYDLLIVRKLKIPNNPEAGFGAVTIDESITLNEELLKYIPISQASIDLEVKKTIENIKTRIKLYKGSNDFLNVKDKNVILTDDGLASGYTMISGIKSIRKMNPNKIIVAIPTASMSSIEKVEKLVSELYCPNVRGTPFAVASAYNNWYDLDDDEVLELLKNSTNFIDNI
ncbi:MAG: phosphoribosyltransferase [Candidatus Lokiarchaeota archaeon]|nr:phosphoribosyltransferase [Candidatus Lokiarchaeota archaeon]